MFNGKKFKTKLAIGGILAVQAIIAAIGCVGPATPDTTQLPRNVGTSPATVGETLRALSSRAHATASSSSPDQIYLGISNFNPQTVADGGKSPFDLEFTIENSSDYVAQNMVVTVTGVFPSDFGKEPDFFSQTLEELPSQKKRTISFQGMNHELTSPGNISVPVHVTVNYDLNGQSYSTDAVHPLLVRHVFE